MSPLALMALHHLPDLDAGLREARRVLRPGGRLHVFELGRLTLHQLGALWPAGELFNKRQLAEHARGAAFAVEQVCGNELRFRLVARRGAVRG